MTTPLVPINDAAAFLGGVSRQTMYRLIADGELNLIKVRDRSFVRLADLEAFIAKQASQSRDTEGGDE